MQQTDAALVKRGHDIVRCDWDRHPLTSTGGRVVTVAGRVVDTSTKQGEERDDAPLLSGGVVFLAPVEDDAGSGLSWNSRGYRACRWHAVPHRRKV